MTITIVPFSTRLIGQTEKALGAILQRLIAPHDLSEPQWVTLSLALRTPPADFLHLARAVADATTWPAADAAARMSELWVRGLLTTTAGDLLVVSDKGRALHQTITAEIVPITMRLWGNLDAGDLETAATVLSTVLHRAHAELGNRETPRAASGVGESGHRS